jgi:hypothetical protein
MECSAERTPNQWYHKAERCYIERHQGCAQCGESHCVFQARWAQRTEYYCSACDFSTCHDGETGCYFAAVGDGRQLAEALLGGNACAEDAAL